MESYNLLRSHDSVIWHIAQELHSCFQNDTHEATAVSIQSIARSIGPYTKHIYDQWTPDLTLATFELSSMMGVSPPTAAHRLADYGKSVEGVVRCEAAGPYVNIELSHELQRAEIGRIRLARFDPVAVKPRL